ncbi:hypothetical protein [Rhizobium sp. No.120]
MSALFKLNPSNWPTTIAFAALVAVTLAAAAEAHTFCRLYCIHGDQMVFANDICSNRISH